MRYLIAAILALLVSIALAQTPPVGSSPIAGNIQTNGRAVCNSDGVGGGTDDAPALNAFFASGIRYAWAQGNVACRASSTIVIPGGMTLEGQAFSASNGAGAVGLRIVCDTNVTPCIQIGANNNQNALRKVIVDRAVTTPPASSIIGLQVVDAYNIILEDVMSRNHGICYQYVSHPSTGLGIAATATRTFGGRCSDAYIDVVSWPELHMTQGRYGMVGPNDFDANTFIRIEGGVSGTAGGPNGIYVSQVQFNQGSHTVQHWIEFVNLGSGGVPAIDATDHRFSENHVEGVSGAYIYSDSSWNLINRIELINNMFNSTSTPLFLLDSATGLSVVTLIGNHFAGGVGAAWTLAPTSAFSALLMVGNYFGGGVTLTAPPALNSTGSITANAFGNGITIGGPWQRLGFHDNTLLSGAITNTATGVLSELSGRKLLSPSGVAPGGAFARMEWVPGTTGGTCKLIAYAGTSTTPTTIVDNVGGGC